MVQSTIVSSTCDGAPEGIASSSETTVSPTEPTAVAPAVEETPTRTASPLETSVRSSPGIIGGSRWKRAFFKIIKYPLMILVVNILLIGYIKRSLSDADLELNLKPVVPPFH